MQKNKLKNKKRGKISKKTFSPLSTVRLSHPLAIISLVFVTLLAAASIQTTQKFSTSSLDVLGEDEQSEEQKQAEEAVEEAEKQAEEAQKESAKQRVGRQEQKEKAAKTTTTKTTTTNTTTTNTTVTSGSSRKSIKSKTVTISPSGVKMKTETEGNKRETEIETVDGQKIRTKIEDDGATKIEIENGTLKLKYSIENGQVVLKAEDEDGEEVEIEDDELEELESNVEDELEDDDIKLVATTDNQLALTQNQIAALTDFPLSINAETKQLVVTTPAGQKTVWVLPGEAVDNLLATGIVNKIETPPSGLAAQDQLGTLTGVVEIETRDNEIVYKIKGSKVHHVLGIIPITTPVTAFVSTDTGLTVAKQQSILTNFIDLLSSN